MEFDDLFVYIGEFGTYQLVLFLTLGLLSFHPGWQNMGMAILGASMDHWCTVDGLEGLPYDEQKRLGIPYDVSEDEYEQCESYIRDFSNYTDEELCYGNFSHMSTETQECSEWTYDRTEFAEFPVSKFDLVCEDTYLISLSSTFYMVGLLVGAPTSGVLSDMFGRFPLMMVGIVLHILAGVCAAYSPGYWSFTFSRFLVSASAHCAYLCGFVILMEVTGPKYRSIIGCLFQMHFSIGYMLLPVMAYFVRDSTYLMMCMAIPVVASLFMAIMIPESPRWLVNKERYEEAKYILHQIADINKVTLPKDMDFTDTKQVEKGKFLDIFRYPTLLKNILIIYLGWFCNSLLYYGLGLNAGTLSGSIFVNVFIGGAVEIPAVLVSIWGMYYFGRRPTLAWGFVVAAGANFLCIPFLNNDDLAIVVTIFAAIGKACIKLTFCVIYVYTAELFPTPVRHLAVGSSSMMSRFGGLLAPFMGEPMLQIWEPLPSIIFGVVALASGILSFLLPETLGKEMPDTFEDAINIAKKYPGVEVDINATEDGIKGRPSSAHSGRMSSNKVDVMKSQDKSELAYETPYQNAADVVDSRL